MTNRCPESSELLSLALGQVLERRKKALEVHITSCATCAQEYTALVQLRSAVRERAPQLPGGLAERTWRSLPERKVPARWRPLAIGTGTAALAGILALTLLPGTPLQPTPAFAQVKQAMDKVDTATWNETVYFTGQEGKEQKISNRECWAQVSSARISYREKEDALNKELMIVHGEHMWVVSPQRKQWRLLDAWRARRQFYPAVSAPELVRQEILFPRDPAAWQERTNTSVPGYYASHVEHPSAWKPERDGELLRFRRTITLPESPNRPTGTETVWVQKNTFRIIRREIVYRIPIQNKKKFYVLTSRKLSDNYRYDLTPPAGVFTVPVPEPGIPYIFSDMSQKQKLPLAKDRQAAYTAMARAASAWKRKHVSRFLSCWDWKNYSLIEQSRSGSSYIDATDQVQKQWRTAVTAGNPFPRWEIERVKIYPANNGAYTRSTKDSPFPPADSSPSGLAMVGTARVTDSQGQRWRVLLSAQLQRQPNGEFRLTSFALSPRRLAPL